MFVPLVDINWMLERNFTNDKMAYNFSSELFLTMYYTGGRNVQESGFKLERKQRSQSSNLTCIEHNLRKYRR